MQLTVVAAAFSAISDLTASKNTTRAASVLYAQVLALCVSFTKGVSESTAASRLCVHRASALESALAHEHTVQPLFAQRVTFISH
jgi:hypothetical protein